MKIGIYCQKAFTFCISYKLRQLGFIKWHIESQGIVRFKSLNDITYLEPSHDTDKNLVMKKA